MLLVVVLRGFTQLTRYAEEVEDLFTVILVLLFDQNLWLILREIMDMAESLAEGYLRGVMSLLNS